MEAVFDEITESGGCRVGDLARRFAVIHVTVSWIVSRLASEQLLETAPYRPITLTSEGQKLARRVKRRHEIVFEFLLALGVSKETATIDSEGMEHHVSSETITAMKRFIKNETEKD